MHFVVLVGRNPVVVGHMIVGQVEGQLLQGCIVLREPVGRSQVVAAVGIGEEHHGIMFGRVVVLN